MRLAALALVVSLFGCAPVLSAVAGPTASARVLGEVNESALADLSAEIASAPPGEFEIYFNSPGGSVFDGLDFLRTMEAAQKRGVLFVCTADMAASMGLVLFSACDVRIALPRALFLAHQAATTTRGNVRQHEETAATLQAVSDALYRQIARVLNISFEEFKRRANGRDYWFGSAEAKEIGLVQLVQS